MQTNKKKKYVDESYDFYVNLIFNIRPCYLFYVIFLIFLTRLRGQKGRRRKEEEDVEACSFVACPFVCC